MATKKSSGGVYRVTEIIGTSAVSWEEAAKNAVETAAKSLRDLRVAESRQVRGRRGVVPVAVDDHGWIRR